MSQKYCYETTDKICSYRGVIEENQFNYMKVLSRGCRGPTTKNSSKAVSNTLSVVRIQSLKMISTFMKLQACIFCVQWAEARWVKLTAWLRPDAGNHPTVNCARCQIPAIN